jgi:hypothetical protein
VPKGTLDNRCGAGIGIYKIQRHIFFYWRHMGQSSVQLQDLVDDARTYSDYAPVLPTGGFSINPALSIANDTLQNMLSGGPDGQPFNWKWNRMLDPTFFLNSWQQDYFIPNLVTCGWLESCTATNFSVTTSPKPIRPVEVKRDLLITSTQASDLAKICWMQNDTMITGVWGQSTAASSTGLTNPGPGQTYTDPSTQPSMPINPISQVKDAFGNLWVVTGYGTCGNTNPFATNLNPVFPTLQTPTTVATTVADGSVTWTAVNPKGQGFRISPIPGQTGPVWQIAPVAQNRVRMFTSLQDFLDPIPDDFYQFFKQGFFAMCARRSPDNTVRAQFKEEYAIWLKAMDNAVKQGSREMDDWGFYPTCQVMETGVSYYQANPAQPYGPWNN